MGYDLKIRILGLLNASDTQKTINKQLEDIQKNIKKLEVKFNIDTNGLQNFSKQLEQLNKTNQILLSQLQNSFNKTGHTHGQMTNDIIGQQVKIQRVTNQTSKLSGEGLAELQSRMNQIKQSVDQYAKVTMQTYANTNKLKSATIEYRNELGQMVKEQMKWKEVINKTSDGELVKKKIFKTTGITLTDDVSKYQKEIEKLNKVHETFRNKIEELKTLGVSDSKLNPLNHLFGNLDVNNFKKYAQQMNIMFKELKKEQQEFIANNKGIDQQISFINSKIQNLTNGKSGIVNPDIIERERIALVSLIQELEKLKQSQGKITEEFLRNQQRELDAIQNRINAQKRVEGSTNKYNEFDIYEKQRKYLGNIYALETRYKHTIDYKEIEKLKKEISDLNNVPLDKLDHKLRETAIKIKNIELEASRASRTMMGQLANALEKISTWGISTSVVYGSINAFQEMLATIIQVDSQVTELHKVLSEDTNWTELMNSATIAANNFGQTLTNTLDSVIKFSHLYQQ